MSCAIKIPTLSFCYDPLTLTVRVRGHTKLVINWVSNSGFDLCSHMKGAGLSYLEAFHGSCDFFSTENNPYECQPSRDVIRQWFQIYSERKTIQVKCNTDIKTTDQYLLIWYTEQQNMVWIPVKYLRQVRCCLFLRWRLHGNTKASCPIAWYMRWEIPSVSQFSDWTGSVGVKTCWGKKKKKWRSQLILNWSSEHNLLPTCRLAAV